MSELSERENLLLALDGKTPERVPNFGKAAVWYESPVVRRRPLPSGFTIDSFGVEFTNTIDGHIPAHTTTGVCRLDDICDWKSIMPQIDLDSIDWEDESRNFMSKTTAMYGTGDESGEKATNYLIGFLWDELHYMLGFEQALLSLITEPEACYDFLQAAADFWIDAWHHQVKYFKPDIAMLIDHVANAKNLLMSPEQYREIIKPAQKRVIQAIVDEGVRPQMHVDGYIDSIIPDYDEIGVHIIQPFQVFNDIEKAKKDYGIICVGGWDAFGRGNQEDSTEAEVRQSVRDAIDKYAPSGQYVFYGSGATPRHPERLRWIEEEADSYGRAFMKK